MTDDNIRGALEDMRAVVAEMVVLIPEKVGHYREVDKRLASFQTEMKRRSRNSNLARQILCAAFASVVCRHLAAKKKPRFIRWISVRPYLRTGTRTNGGVEEAASPWTGRNYPPAWRAASSGGHSASEAEGAIKQTQQQPASSPPSIRKPPQTGKNDTRPQSSSMPSGSRPKPIQPFPDPLFEASQDPAAFQDALVYHMRRFGESYWQLYRAVIRLGETFDDKTLLSWIQVERVPRSVASFGILGRI